MFRSAARRLLLAVVGIGFVPVVMTFLPPENSLTNVQCNIRGIQMFVVNSFEVHSSIRDESTGELVKTNSS